MPDTLASHILTKEARLGTCTVEIGPLDGDQGAAILALAKAFYKELGLDEEYWKHFEFGVPAFLDILGRFYNAYVGELDLDADPSTWTVAPMAQKAHKVLAYICGVSPEVFRKAPIGDQLNVLAVLAEFEQETLVGKALIGMFGPIGSTLKGIWSNLTTTVQLIGEVPPAGTIESSTP